jgi:hypothetical protein
LGRAYHRYGQLATLQIAAAALMIWKLIEHQDYLVKPDGFNIPYDAERIHVFLLN